MRIGLRIFLGYFLIVALAALLLAQVFLAQVKPGVRQAMEDTLVDTANVLAELATDDFEAGRIDDGRFAHRVRALAERDFGAEVWGFGKRAASYRVYVTDAQGIVRFDSSGRDVGADYSQWNDVHLTLRGRYGARSSPDPRNPESTVMHVAAPILDDAGAVIGVLTVAKPNSAISPFIERSQAVVLRWGMVLMGVSLLVGLLVAWWLSRQIGRLRQYAHAVTAGERADAPRAAGEFGELGRALETMRTRLEGKQYVEQYVHTLTHEMKSPLAAIRGSAELLESPLPEADRKHFAGSIRTQSERLAQMIDKLLALAAVEHRQRVDAVPLRLDLLVGEVEALCEPRLEAASVRLESKITGAPVVAGDAFLLRQAIANLVENAVDFAPAGSTVKVELSSASADGEGEVVLEVADEGSGVPDYALPRVFERFFSLPRPRGGSRSSGLGLCFVAEVAALHGGRATLGNREGGGAVARLHLPLHE